MSKRKLSLLISMTGRLEEVLDKRNILFFKERPWITGVLTEKEKEMNESESDLVAQTAALCEEIQKLL